MLVHIYWCDMVAAAANAQRASVEKTHCVLNTVAVQTAQFTLDNKQIISAANLTDELTRRLSKILRGSTPQRFVKLFGNAIAANLFLVGYAFQLD